MKCTEARPLLSSYMDGALNGSEIHGITAHLRECGDCDLEFRSLEKTRSLISSLGRKPAPPDLALKIRVAVSNARSQTLAWTLRSFFVRAQDAVNAFMLPATAGTLTAVIFFGIVIGFFVPPTVRADDVPTIFYTPPRLVDSSFFDNQISVDSQIVIETDVDPSGRVEDYRIVAGRDDNEIRQQLNRALLFTRFVPAQTFGKPVSGRAVISFARVNVKG